MYMPVLVEECSMGMCSSWIVHTVLEWDIGWNSEVENGMEQWV